MDHRKDNRLNIPVLKAKMATNAESSRLLTGPKGKSTRFMVKRLYDRLNQEVMSHIDSGNVDVAIKLISSRSSEINNADENGFTLLMALCVHGNRDIVRTLIDHGAYLNSLDAEGRTALMFASRDGHHDVVATMLESDVDTDVKDLGGWTALMWACYRGHAKCAELLLEKDRSAVNVRAMHNMTCLHWAAGRGHLEVVEVLLRFDAKLDVMDKYGSTPLIWAARKGFLSIVKMLLEKGASVDTVGMYSWTALLIALHNKHEAVSAVILQYEPNLNITDKDGHTALAMAAKEGFTGLVQDMIDNGAYINVLDKNTDSVLHHAVKGGHLDIVVSLLRKNPDINTPGNDGKTVLHLAVEKGHTRIAKHILLKNPDKETSDLDGNTPLLRAVKCRDIEMASELLEKGARISAADKKGDTCLHIAMRTRNRRMLELLLKNPRHSRYLYLQNRAGETAYSLDCTSNNRKSLLAHIFGARTLNSPQSVESQFGYELYSSALADILASPTLNTPMSVGLFAKWGSGKSFLLGKLKDDMKAYTKQSPRIYFEFSWTVFLLTFSFSLITGLIAAGIAQSGIVGGAVGSGLFVLIYSLLALIFCLHLKKDYEYIERLSCGLARYLLRLRLLMYVLFFNRPTKTASQDSAMLQSINFIFAESTKLTSLGGQQSVASMISSIFVVLEKRYGTLVTRLYKEFGSRKESRRRYKSICCIPYFLIFLFFAVCLITGLGLVWFYKGPAEITDTNYYETVNAIMLTLTGLVGLSLVLSVPNIWKALRSYIRPSQRRTKNASMEATPSKTDKLLHKLKHEAITISSLVTSMDRHENWQTRLVLIIDGLDSCEQDKVLQVLDTINLVIPDNSPFIILLALDPHVIIKGLENSLLHGLNDSGLNGHGYLRNLIHLPFYLQSHSLPKLYTNGMLEGNGVKKWVNVIKEVKRKTKVKEIDRQQSAMSSTMSIDQAWRTSAKKGRTSTHHQPDSMSVADPFSSNILLGQASEDMPRNIMKNDYFIDVNPRSMRRLMNIIAVAGRLLRADSLEFDWYRLSAWINITEQWPYRTSWMLLYYEEMEGKLEDNISLLHIYDQVRSRIPTSRDVDPHIDLDRNEKKFLAFLKSHVPRLDVEDLRRFTPATINLDPYLRKMIKDRIREQEQFELQLQSPTGLPSGFPPGTHPLTAAGLLSANQQPGMIHNRSAPTFGPPFLMNQPVQTQMMTSAGNVEVNTCQRRHPKIPKDCKRLKYSSVDDVCDLLSKIKGISPESANQYRTALHNNNINGRVLLDCDLMELKPELHMNFGDWQLFKNTITAMREKECLELSDSTPSLYSHPSFSSARGQDQCGPIQMSRQATQSGGESESAPSPAPTRKSPVTRDPSLDSALMENHMIMAAVAGTIPSDDSDDEQSAYDLAASDSDDQNTIKFVASHSQIPRATVSVPATVERSQSPSPSRSIKFTLVNEIQSDKAPLIKSANEIEMGEFSQAKSRRFSP